MDQAATPVKPNQEPFRPGAIRRIKLTNFMCHDSFELDFGARVNFIIGPNGSGKSAILTAIVVVLGGRATATSRAKRTSEFVKYGKKYAKIVLELHNFDKIMDKQEAFKPEEYGKRIILEKIIYKDDQAAKFFMKDDREKKVTERRHELDELLEHFRIDINNPICVLNQEVSKSFLHSKRPEDKYDLYMKATTLELIENDYNEAHEVYEGWTQSNNKKKSGIEQLNRERADGEEKLNFLLNRVKLRDKLKKLQHEVVWALLRDNEVKAEAKNAELLEKMEEVEKSDVYIKRYRQKIEAADEGIKELKVKMESCTKECDKTKEKIKIHKQDEFKIRSKKIDLTNELELEKRKEARLDRDRKGLEESINKMKNQQSNRDQAHELEKRKLEIEQLDREKTVLDAREKVLRQNADQIHKSLTDLNKDLNMCRARINGLKQELSYSESNLRTLHASKGSELRKYGPHMQKICEAVERAFRQGRFHKKPLGPLGYFVKVKQPGVAKALEIHVGRNAHAFTCNDNHDMLVLREILNEVRQSDPGSFREPPILSRKFCNRHDVSKLKAHHLIHKTLLDLITIEESAVFNALVDRTSLESVLFIPDYDEARNIMVSPDRVPANTRCAYTSDCHVMYPRTKNSGFKVIARDHEGLFLFSVGNEDQIKLKMREIETLKADLRSVEANEMRLQDNVKLQRDEFDRTMAECNKILSDLRAKESRILELRCTLTEEPQVLSVFDTELEECIEKLNQTRANIAKLEYNLQEVATELKDKSIERESTAKVLAVKGQELEELLEEQKREYELISRHKDNIKKTETLMRNIENTRREKTAELVVIQEQVDKYKKELGNSIRPDTIRPTKDIQTELNKTQTSLNVEVEQNRDPQELIDSIRRRQKEIAMIGSQAQHNESNHSMMGRSLKDRKEGFKILRAVIARNVGTTFSSVMNNMDMSGSMNIHYEENVVGREVLNKAKTLEMSIDTAKSSASQRPMNVNNATVEQRSTSSQSKSNTPNDSHRPKRARLTLPPPSSSGKENLHMTDTRSLSGGERSFTTVAFVLALWHHCATPFKLMDEVDVFMDMVTRRMSYNALIKFAQLTETKAQFIYLSPLELPEIDCPESMVSVFEMPHIEREGVLSLGAPSLPGSER